MKIAHVISGYLPQDSGGTQLHLRDLAHSLQRQGHECVIFTRLGGDEFGHLEISESEWEGVRVTRMTNNFADVSDFKMLFQHEGMDALFREYLEREKPDVVHFHHVTCVATSMIRAAKSLGLPVVMTLHDYWTQCPRGQRIHPKTLDVCEKLDRHRCASCLHDLWPHLLPDAGVEGFWARLFGRSSETLDKLSWWESYMKSELMQCDALIAPSRFHRERFVDWGLAADRCVAIPHGLPKGEIQAEPRGSAEIRRIGFIGTVIPSKGVHVLVEAFARLGRKDLSLEIYGEIPDFHGEGGYRAELEKAAKGLSMNLHGRYENRDLPQVLASFDVLVVPSLWWESFCLTAREGAIAGLPVVASRIGGIADAVDEGIALGFAPGDASDLARVLQRLLDEPELRDAMSRKGPEVRELDEAAQLTVGVYERTLRGEGPGAALL
jgi:glycosyltransferase involved in cell wall biosynthesis